MDTFYKDLHKDLDNSSYLIMLLDKIPNDDIFKYFKDLFPSLLKI